MSEKYKLIKYENKGIELDVRSDVTNNTICLTQNEIAILFNKTKSNISILIKNIINEKEQSVFSSGEITESDVKYHLTTELLSSDGKTYKTKLYNLDMLEAISLRSKSTSGYEFIKWAREKLSDIRNTSLTEHSPYEAVEQTYLKYYDGEISMDVKLSLNKVWLTQEQIAKLFDKDVSIISRHIKNILATGECDKSNLQKMQIPFSDKLVNIYVK